MGKKNPTRRQRSDKYANKPRVMPPPVTRQGSDTTSVEETLRAIQLANPANRRGGRYNATALDALQEELSTEYQARRPRYPEDSWPEYRVASSES